LALYGCWRPEKIILQQVMTGFDTPVHLNSPPGDSSRLFVVELKGKIWIIKNKKKLPTPFLDIEQKVRSGGEMGLLSIEFHPQYQKNHYFYVCYIDLQRHTRIVRYTTSKDNPDRADMTSTMQLTRFKKPYKNHNGGLLKFGPDGMLYIGLGDGGKPADANHEAQNRATLFGSILRVDVDHGEPYTIPPDNPYANHKEFKPEIWAYGLRNPWRFAFDPNEELFYIADVGEKTYEEVNVVPAKSPALNFGWSVMEGTRCFRNPNCKKERFVQPVEQYTHKEGCAIVGGMVYRGDELYSIRGHYFYGDWCLGFIRSFRYENGKAVDQRQWNLGVPDNITSFGEDSDRNMYLVYESGKIYRFAKQPS
jgi:glucose/arabinose dehydrogenase